MARKAVESVTYVEDGDHFALVLGDDGGGRLNLYVLFAAGAGGPAYRASVPEDNSDTPGNVTWH